MLLEVKRLCAAYGAADVLFDVSLAIAEGEAVSLIGPNGAGKTTLLKSLMGLLPTKSGAIVLNGQEITGLEPYERARLGLGFVAEERRIFTDLTVAENLEVARKGQGWTVERLLTLFPNLKPLLKRRASSMSGGEQQMLAIARTLMGNPRLLLLDEPSEGLAPVIVEAMKLALKIMVQDGVTLLISEQNHALIDGLCNRTYTIKRGIVTAL